MQRMDDLIGQRVLVAIRDSKEAGYTVTLHGTETGGIWIESEQHEQMLGFPKAKAKSRKIPPRKPIFFLPFAQILFLVAFSTELDELGFRG